LGQAGVFELTAGVQFISVRPLTLQSIAERTLISSLRRGLIARSEYPFCHIARDRMNRRQRRQPSSRSLFPLSSPFSTINDNWLLILPEADLE
jgi:hypothetical protein